MLCINFMHIFEMLTVDCHKVMAWRVQAQSQDRFQVHDGQATNPSPQLNMKYWIVEDMLTAVIHYVVLHLIKLSQ